MSMKLDISFEEKPTQCASISRGPGGGKAAMAAIGIGGMAIEAAFHPSAPVRQPTTLSCLLLSLLLLF